MPTGHYYNGNQEWVAAPKDARDFGSVDAALEAVIKEGLDRMSLVLRSHRSDTEHVYHLFEEKAPTKDFHPAG